MRWEKHYLLDAHWGEGAWVFSPPVLLCDIKVHLLNLCKKDQISAWQQVESEHKKHLWEEGDELALPSITT